MDIESILKIGTPKLIVIGVIISTVMGGIWWVAHSTAEPGTEVRVLWISYTKKNVGTTSSNGQTLRPINTSADQNVILDVDDKERWSKNWELLKQARLNRRTRECESPAASNRYKVFNRRPIISSLSMLSFLTGSEQSAKRDKLLKLITEAPADPMVTCYPQGDHPEIDLRLSDEMKNLWNNILVDVKAKASSVDVDLTFQWSVAF